ncbi:integrase catalytic domain-containing protein, partial [Methylobacter psychrophilus]|uniref:integrase catalytic domain-containing protein n=1 Tax=Methylobacter psychrophilus TaxID=96941 RepID=UPI0021D4D2D0
MLVDIATGWLECIPLLRKSAKDVIDGLRIVDELLPFPMQGLDTDCGSEFINYELLDYCEDRQITFTKARTHRKNDQAHIEEKNGSVVRRLVGYDRLEDRKAWEALVQLYRVLRKYITYFQPSLKLIGKERCGAKVSKKYDSAKTPYQRVLLSEHISQANKDLLTHEYEAIDPVNMLNQLEILQDQLWTFSWNKNGKAETHVADCAADNVGDQEPVKPVENTPVSRYYRTNKITDLRKAPRI